MVFFVARVIPIDPVAAILPGNAPQKVIEETREKLGLNKPLWVQYVQYVKGVLHGDLGVSIRTQRPVLDDILRYFPATLELTVAALFMGVIIGISLGVISAVRQRTVFDSFSRIFAVLGISMPTFVSGLMFILLFSYILHWLPQLGQIPPYLSRPPRVTGLLILDTMISGEWGLVIVELKHLILPAFTLGWLSVASITRITRSSMLDVLPEEYIKTARMKGLRESSVILKHALKNAMLPTITMIGLRFGSLLGGAVVTETVFCWPGLGRYVATSCLSLDFPAVVGVSAFIAFLFTSVNIAVDLVYCYLDPRIHYA